MVTTAGLGFEFGFLPVGVFGLLGFAHFSFEAPAVLVDLVRN